MTPSERIVLALDVPTDAEALAWARRFRGRVGMVKVGLRLFTAGGPALVERLISGFGPVFLDLKYHDVPSTVASAVREAARLGASLITVHASGGIAMLRGACEAAQEAARGRGDPAGARTNERATLPGAGPASPETAQSTAVAGAPLLPFPVDRPRVLAVTVLTSLGPEDLAAAGVARSPTDQVVALAETAWLAGCDGFVASPLEAAAIRDRIGAGAILVTPGIRSPGDPADDQHRTATPRQAVDAGADLLVIGRPILSAADPDEALERILRSLA